MGKAGILLLPLQQRKVTMWVAQLCLTLCDPMCPPGSSVPGILQARTLEWVAIPFSRGSSRPRDQTQVLLHCRRILYHLSHQGSLYNLSNSNHSRTHQIAKVTGQPNGLNYKERQTPPRKVRMQTLFPGADARPHTAGEKQSSKNVMKGLPRWLSGEESTCQCRVHGCDPWSGKIPH